MVGTDGMVDEEDMVGANGMVDEEDMVEEVGAVWLRYILGVTHTLDFRAIGTIETFALISQEIATMQIGEINVLMDIVKWE